MITALLFGVCIRASRRAVVETLAHTTVDDGNGCFCKLQVLFVGVLTS